MFRLFSNWIPRLITGGSGNSCNPNYPKYVSTMNFHADYLLVSLMVIENFLLKPFTVTTFLPPSLITLTTLSRGLQTPT